MVMEQKREPRGDGEIRKRVGGKKSATRERREVKGGRSGYMLLSLPVFVYVFADAAVEINCQWTCHDEEKFWLRVKAFTHCHGFPHRQVLFSFLCNTIRVRFVIAGKEQEEHRRHVKKRERERQERQESSVPSSWVFPRQAGESAT